MLPFVGHLLDPTYAMAMLSLWRNCSSPLQMFPLFFFSTPLLYFLTHFSQGEGKITDLFGEFMERNAASITQVHPSVCCEILMGACVFLSSSMPSLLQEVCFAPRRNAFSHLALLVTRWLSLFNLRIKI